MLPQSLSAKDKRGALLSVGDIHRWYDTRANGYRIGLRSQGEFRMGSEAGSVLITKPDNSEWMNFGSYRFYFPDWNCGSTAPEQWNNPLTLSEDGEYLALNWLFFHVHGDMVPVAIHIPSRSFSLVEPRRILGIRSLSIATGRPILKCVETLWIRAAQADYPEREFPVPCPCTLSRSFINSILLMSMPRYQSGEMISILLCRW